VIDINLKKKAHIMSAHNPKTIEIVCSDGVHLAASLYLPSKIKAAVLIAPATGIKRNFYKSFAIFLCAHDYAVL